jgi:hypothetical protein
VLVCRYFVLVKDNTLRRFADAEAVDNHKKPPRVYQLSDIEFVGKDMPPRFFLKMKSKKVDAEGESIKFTADTDGECLAWVRTLSSVLTQMQSPSEGTYRGHVRASTSARS